MYHTCKAGLITNRNFNGSTVYTSIFNITTQSKEHTLEMSIKQSCRPKIYRKSPQISSAANSVNLREKPENSCAKYAFNFGRQTFS